MTTTPLDPFHHLDATAQAELVASGEASSRELTEAAIARIETLDGPLNSITSRRFERALEEADAVDGSPKAGRGPFAGVPFVVKDADALAGEPLTLGSRLFKDFVPKKDSAWIAQMRAAGLVALGKTNLPELGLIHTTEGQLLGPCLNPWDHGISTGGSSGGSCVAIATGMVPVASASDGGGSIRYPSSSCGVVGLKPSRGRGMPPEAGFEIPGDPGVVFAVSRTVRDTAKLLDISDAGRVAAGIGSDPAIGFIERAGTKPLKIAMITKTVLGDDPEPDVLATVQQAAAWCDALGHTVEEVELPMDGQAFMNHIEMCWAYFPAMLEKRFSLVRAMACGWKFWTWPSKDEVLEPWTRGLAKMFRDRERLNKGHAERAKDFLAQAARDYAAFFEQWDVIIGPVQRRATHPIGLLDTTMDFEELKDIVIKDSGYAAIQNFLGLPAISLPLGETRAGQPIGVMFTGPSMGEARLLELAYQFEEAHPWAHRWPPAG